MRRSLILLLAFASTTAFAQTYRWVDPATGKTVFSDTPPPGNAKSVSKTQPQNSETALSFEVKRAAENFPVTLFTTADCTTDCRQARELLNARGVPFSEKMVQSVEDRDELKKAVGELFIPSLKVGKQAQRGFSAETYNNLLDLAGYPKSAPYGSKPSGGLAK